VWAEDDGCILPACLSEAIPLPVFQHRDVTACDIQYQLPCVFV
jgi:hypothetical protein